MICVEESEKKSPSVTVLFCLEEGKERIINRSMEQHGKIIANSLSL